MECKMSSSTSASRAQKPFYASFGFQVFVAMAIGLVLGYIARQIGPTDAGPNWLVQTLSTIGSIFVQLLRALVPLLIFTAIVASIANLRELNNAARLVWQTLLWFAITALIAVLIGIVLGLVIQPGINSGVAATAAAAPSSTGSWLDFLKGLIPSNVLGLQASTSTSCRSLWFRLPLVLPPCRWVKRLNRFCPSTVRCLPLPVRFCGGSFA
jgi:Na+/H+-dicarboxylate symporter